MTLSSMFFRDLAKKYVFTSKNEFFSNFFYFHVLIKNKTNALYIFFSLKLHKLPYYNLFIGFNNILKKIPFSCYIKCNTSYCNKKIYIYISFRRRIFQCFFFTLPCFDWKWRKKARNILTFYCNSFFFSQNGIIYLLFSVFKRINISSKKPYLFLVQKKEIYAITRKKVPFHRKSRFFDDFLLISLFS